MRRFLQVLEELSEEMGGEEETMISVKLEEEAEEVQNE